MKELAQAIVRAGKAEIRRAGQKARDAGERCCYNLESEIHRLETQPGFLCCSLEVGFLPLWETSDFSLKAFN